MLFPLIGRCQMAVARLLLCVLQGFASGSSSASLAFAGGCCFRVLGRLVGAEPLSRSSLSSWEVTRAARGACRCDDRLPI